MAQANAKPYLGSTVLDVHHPDVFPSSPMALIGIFIAIIQDRFSGTNAEGLPYYWDPDPTPDHDEDNSNEKPRRIYIESQFSEFPDARDVLPSILVDKEETRADKQWFGHRGHINLPDRNEVYVMFTTSSMSILVGGRTRGESATLAEHIFMFLATCTPFIRETFSIHDISVPIMSKTTPQRRSGNDIEFWNTTINFQVQTKVLWRTKPIAPRLQEIRSKLSLGADKNHVDLDIEQYVGRT